FQLHFTTTIYREFSVFPHSRQTLNAVPRMRSLRTVRHWFRLGNARTAAGRALLIEQYRILAAQAPVLYAVVMVDSASIAFALPSTSPRRVRFGRPAALLAVSLMRVIQWLRLRTIVPTAEQALAHLTKSRTRSAAVNVGFSLWALVLFESVADASRAPVA